MPQKREGLTRARRGAGLTQEELAYRLGVDRSTVGRWELGATEPSAWLRPKLAKLLGLSQADLAQTILPDGVRGSKSAIATQSLIGSFKQIGVESTASASLSRLDISPILNGNLVDLELNCEIRIYPSGVSEVIYKYWVVNLTNKPISRMVREQWFEQTDGRLRIEPHPESDREVYIHRMHDTISMSKFSCVFSPAIDPGEVATIGYIVTGGKFSHDHYWRQSTPRHTKNLVLSVRHHGIEFLENCSAIVDLEDGSQEAAIESLICRHEREEAFLKFTRSNFKPSEAVTVRWEVRRSVT